MPGQVPAARTFLCREAHFPPCRRGFVPCTIFTPFPAVSAMTSGPDKRVFPWLGGVIDISP